MFREDFPILKENIIYFDNAATSLKPKILTEKMNEYYHKYCSNIYRGIYDISVIADTLFDATRKKIANFIDTESDNEIVFTSGTTDSINKIVFGFFEGYLKEEDEILLSRSEHASNIIPWFELANKIKCRVKYIDLDDCFKINIKNVKKAITKKTKVISIAHMTNVVGDIRPLKEIIELAHQLGILVVVDGAQSVSHMPVSVKKLDIDFMAFSAHKMCGPTGVGVLYAKEKYLNHIKPIIYGGGMNDSFNDEGICLYKDIPFLLEAGTPNIAGVIAFGYAIDYLSEIGMDKIHKYEMELKNYAIFKLSKLKKIIIYNDNNESGIITLNHKTLNAYDLASYLNQYNICVRSGSHCAKILDNLLDVDKTCRISFYFYNTKEEIDYFIKILEKLNEKTDI